MNARPASAVPSAAGFRYSLRGGAVEIANRLAAREDVDIAADLLAGSHLHAARSTETLRQWAAAAADLGHRMATDSGLDHDPSVPVTEEPGGLVGDQLVLARYLSRPPTVVLHPAAIAAAEAVVTAAGWATLFPAGTVRRAAIAHEVAHGLLDGPYRRRLRACAGPVLLRWGHRSWRGVVVGADEIAAHAYARIRLGLRRSPLLLAAAVTELVRPQPPTDPSRRTKES
ncbi:hypothetical protein [Actinoalloteichus hymeniacidonis]|uniref:Uncharacterized protein n=1 Tax=Actinoalloteichus hymeniacidonis TaxID=340345 RepID=A0AAC9MXV9_9PSEU|nr:hypothetical protein [Actinoalloteichus hymeniacidonis]AOS63748.1 hypothetical protein TL08_14695 [Actinoalloteichus hymeniacidonis]MBB5908198.1 hypothetical protein [Actinoalloteichus hymeniacidonis]